MSGPNPPGPDSEGADDLDQEPGESTAEEGRETFETLAEMLVELIREVAA